METCEMSMIKYFLFIFNLVFSISGIGIIIAGAVVLSNISDFNHFMDNDLIATPIVLIVVGAIVFVVAFFGCFGAIRESYKLLIAFAVCLLVICIIELAVGIAVAVYKNDFADAFKMSMKDSIANYSVNKNEQKSWDQLQEKLGCCGVEGPNDWQGQSVPFSCCHINEERKDEFSTYCLDAAQGKFMYSNGCYDQLKEKINDNAKVLIGVGIGIAFIEVVGIVFSCWLAHTIKKENTEK